MVKLLARPSKKVLIISLVVIALVFLTLAMFARENLAGMVQALGRANYGLAALAFGIYLVCVLFWAVRWRISLSAVGYPASLRHLYLVILGGIFINNITPFTYAGGDPIARTYLLKKTTSIPYSGGFATAVGELILDLPIFFFLFMLGLFTSFYAIPAWMMLVIAGIWILLVVSLLLVVSRFLSRRIVAGKIGGFLTRVFKIFQKRVSKEKVRGGVESFYSGAHAIVGRLKIASLVASFSAILWIFGMIRLFIIFQALGYNPPFAMLILAVTMPAIVGLVPLLPGGLGTVDATIFSVFLLFHVDPPIAMSATLIERSITLIFSTAVGACALSRLGVKRWKKK